MARKVNNVPAEEPKNYEVGYGKPPKNSQWPEGTSGNPAGRRKGSRNFETDARDVLSSKIVIKEDGKSRIVTKQKALLLRAADLGLKGTPGALAKTLNLAAQYNNQAAAPDEQLSEADQSIIDEALLRLLRNRAAGMLDDPGTEGQ